MKTRNKLIAILLVLTASAHDANAQSWSTTGNAGTSGATNFIGTTDNVSLKFRTNNSLRITVTNNGKVGIGNFTPVFRLDVKSGSINTDSLYRIKGIQVLNRDGSNHIQIGDMTAKVSIGAASSSYTFHATGNADRVGNFINTAVSQSYVGLYASCSNTPNYGIGISGSGGEVGVYGVASLVGTGNRMGIQGFGSGGTANYGTYGYAFGGTTANGVYGSAAGGTTNWAGYFENGNVYIQNKMGIGKLTPLYALDVIGDSVAAGNFVNNSNSVDSYAVYGKCNNVPSSGNGIKGEGGYLGVEGEAKMAGSGSRIGVRGKASGGAATNWGVVGIASGGNVTYAVYGNATGAASNWAGYFENGNVYIQNIAGIGTASPVYTLDVTSNGFRTANFLNTATATNSFGVYSSCNNTPNLGYGVYAEGGFKGVLAHADLAGTGNRFGVDATGKNGSDYNYGIRGTATGGLQSYGLYGTASGSSVSNWAGYFDDGNVYVKNRLRISDVNVIPGYSLDIVSPDFTAAVIKSGVNGGTTFKADAGSLTGNIWAVYGSAPVSGYAGYFSGNTFCTGSYLPSDEKLKENIQPLENALEKVLKLDVKTYQFKQGLEKMNLPAEKQYGYIAQNLESVFPELVKLNPAKEDQPLEFKAVNYTGMIPVLTAAIQEQQQQMAAKDETIQALQSTVSKIQSDNAALQSRLDQFETALSQCCMNFKSGSGADGTDQARLEQNIPNPFTETTIIKYYIPATASGSVIKIYSADGSELRSAPVLTKGFGQTEISGSALPAGIYTYLLLVDGSVVDTKQMVLTR